MNVVKLTGHRDIEDMNSLFADKLDDVSVAMTETSRMEKRVWDVELSSRSADRHHAATRNISARGR